MSSKFYHRWPIFQYSATNILSISQSREPSHILPYALEHAEEQDLPRLNLVRKFLRDIFHYDAAAGDQAEDFPSLVDVLSVVDIALDRHENLARGYGQDQLFQVREALEYAIFRALEHSLSFKTKTQRPRSNATKDLVRKLEPSKSAIISLNYDVIIDIALAYRHNADFAFDTANAERLSDREAKTVGIDYGIDFANLPSEVENRFRLFKLHGSFNWLWSKVTGNIYFGGLNKAIARLFDEKSERVLDIKSYYGDSQPGQFAEWKRDLAPILITPTHLKDLRNAYLAELWRKAETALRQAQRVTFIGYSLPPDDIHLKYMMKRAMETSEQRPEIVVVDYSDKPEGQRTAVEDNYRRFFGTVKRYYRKGFEKYVQEEL